MNAPGKNFLLVTGILYIIFGAIGFIGALGMQTMVQAAPWVFAAMQFAFGVNIGFLVGLLFVASIAYIVLGICGIVHREKPEYGKPLMIFVIILAIYELFAAFLYSDIIDFSILTLIGFALPALFIVGAYKNHDAWERDPVHKLKNTTVNCHDCLLPYRADLKNCPHCGTENPNKPPIMASIKTDQNDTE